MTNEPPTQAARETGHGRHAESPQDIPRQGFVDVAARVRAEVKNDHASLLAAGVAFYSLLALVPALVAVISIYGLAADPARVRAQVVSALSAAPREVRDLVSAQLTAIAGSSGGATILAAAFGIAAALWSASAGMSHLVDALNVAYGEQERRGFVRLKVTALGLTLAATVFVVVAVGVIAVLPALLADTGLGSVGRIAIDIVRWLLLLGGMVVGLSIIYRYGPSRDPAKWRWVSPGAVAAAVLWLVGSFAFSVYTANFAKYNETYGSLGAIVVVMLWLFLTVFAVILGAEVNAELERQTLRDTTEGAPAPIGARHAVAADTVGPISDRHWHRSDHVERELVSDSMVPGDAGAVEPSSPCRFPFLFAGMTGAAARIFGVRSDRAFAEIRDEMLIVRFGSWVVATSVSNVSSAVVTGPYLTSRVAGPARWSLSDGGLTFATNRSAGVCITFDEAVTGLLPFGLSRHRNLTATVADPDGLCRCLEPVIAGSAVTD